MKQFETYSPEETEALAARIASETKPGTIILLRGDLGAGKTAFTRGFARGLGIADPVSSPTFTFTVFMIRMPRWRSGSTISCLTAVPFP